MDSNESETTWTALLVMAPILAAFAYAGGLVSWFLVAKRGGRAALRQARKVVLAALCVFPGFAFIILLIRDVALRLWPALLPDQSPDFAWVVGAPILVALIMAVNLHVIRIVAGRMKDDAEDQRS